MEEESNNKTQRKIKRMKMYFELSQTEIIPGKYSLKIISTDEIAPSTECCEKPYDTAGLGVAIEIEPEFKKQSANPSEALATLKDDEHLRLLENILKLYDNQLMEFSPSLGEYMRKVVQNARPGLEFFDHKAPTSPNRRRGMTLSIESEEHKGDDDTKSGAEEENKEKTEEITPETKSEEENGGEKLNSVD